MTTIFILAALCLATYLAFHLADLLRAATRKENAQAAYFQTAKAERKREAESLIAAHKMATGFDRRRTENYQAYLDMMVDKQTDLT